MKHSTRQLSKFTSLPFNKYMLQMFSQKNGQESTTQRWRPDDQDQFCLPSVSGSEVTKLWLKMIPKSQQTKCVKRTLREEASQALSIEVKFKQIHSQQFFSSLWSSLLKPNVCGSMAMCAAIFCLEILCL